MSTCAELCYNEAKCKAVNYNRYHQVCELLSNKAPLHPGEETARSRRTSDVYFDNILCDRRKLKPQSHLDDSGATEQTDTTFSTAETTDSQGTTSTTVTASELFPSTNPVTQQQTAQETCGIQEFAPNSWKLVAGRLRIVGGVEAKPHSWPWQVALYRQSGQRFFGGGVLFRPDIIITAAHVLDQARKEDITVFAGVHELAARTNDADVDSSGLLEVAIHPDYNRSSADSDIALLKLKTPVRIGPKKKLICLPPAGATVRAGDRCIITGFGLLSPKAQFSELNLPPVLQEAAVNVIEQDTCNSFPVYLDQITKNMFCAGYVNGGIDACQGDSGGPFVCQSGSTWFLQGVISWGEDCAKPSQPGVYAKVSNYIDWITQQADILQKMT